jgi:hypothetical protein
MSVGIWCCSDKQGISANIEGENYMILFEIFSQLYKQGKYKEDKKTHIKTSVTLGS